MELAASGEILQKMAEAEGIDINALSDEDIASLLIELQGGEKVATATPNNDPNPKQTKEASMENELTNADVAVELAKIAQANGIDLDEIEREEYHEAFDKLAERMSDPTYYEEKLAQEEKLAESEALGRHMAQAFVDELNKSAGFREAYAVGRGLGGMSRTRAAYEAAKGTADKGLTRLGKAVRGGERGARKRTTAGMEGVPKERRGMAARLSKADEEFKNRQMGRRVAGGAALLGAGGAAGAALAKGKGKEKKSFDEAFESDAVAVAQHILMENELIDPVEIELSKFASFAGPEYDQAVEERAYELLDEHGWLEG
jgi:hypothetical protein